MQDEQLWLDEAEYETTPIHRLRKAPVAAAIAAAATLALVMALPRSWIERAVYELYIDTVIPAAELPLGDMAHAVVAFVAAAIVAGVAFAVARFVDFGKLLRRRERTTPTADEGETASPRQRRADSHPDAPPRAPFRVGAGLDSDEADEPQPVSIERDDPPFEIDDGGDDEMFDLGGFEAGDEDGFDEKRFDQEGEQDAPLARAIFDVGAIDAPDETLGEEPQDDADRLVSREVADDPMADVREKFADMFGPGDASEDDIKGAERNDLSNLTTGQLIDELERRIAARQGALLDSSPAAPERHAATEPGAQPVVAEQNDAPAAPTPPAQRRSERAANDQMADDRAADDDQAGAERSGDGDSGDDSGGELDDMDAALQAALGTLARMQQRSAG